MVDLSDLLWARAPWFLTAPPEPDHRAPARSRLLRVLDAAIDAAVITVVAAPSGYDKSATLAAWATQREGRTAWLTLTRHEQDDEELLLAGIRTALERLEPPTPPSTRAAEHSASRGRVAIGHIVDLVAGLGDVVLVIDDAHHGGRVLSDGVIDVLVSLTGGHLRVVLSGAPLVRERFARAIAAQRATVITRIELALTPDEVIAEYEHWQLPIDEATARSLVASSHGWPVAVRLGRLAAAAPPVESPGADAWTLDHGPSDLLVAYIEHNVLAPLRPALADFVLAATTCTLLTPDLARALTDVDDAPALLQECVDAGLFLDRYGAPGGEVAYRWNEQFAESCRDLRARLDPARGRMLHERAARWLAPRFPTEAIVHAHRAHMPELALDVIRSSWVRIIIESGARALNAQCLALQVEVGARPELLFIRAACLNLLDDPEGSRLLAQQALAAGGTEAEHRDVRALAGLLLADDRVALAAAADDARAVIDEGGTDPSLNAYRLFLLGWVELRLRRDVAGAVRLLDSAAREAEAARRPLLSRRAHGNLAFALSYGGRLNRARHLLGGGEADEPRDEWQQYDGGIVPFARGFVDYWQGDRASAQRTFLRLAGSDGNDSSYAALARVYAAFCAADAGEPEAIRAAGALLPGISSAERHGVPWPAYRAIAAARLFAASGDSHRAVAIVDALSAAHDIPVARAAAAELLRRAGRREEARRMLRTIAPVAMTVSYIAATANLTAALIEHETGDVRRSHTLLERSLNAAVPEGIRQPYQVDDDRFRELLAAHASAGTAHAEFVASCIVESAPAPDAGTRGAALSAREREIFGYLCTTMTAEEIASALFVSVNTIRTHQRAIYRKLGVSSRREAVRLSL